VRRPDVGLSLGHLGGHFSSFQERLSLTGS
jgi:hypothetical protein